MKRRIFLYAPVAIVAVIGMCIVFRAYYYPRQISSAPLQPGEKSIGGVVEVASPTHGSGLGERKSKTRKAVSNPPEFVEKVSFVRNNPSHPDRAEIIESLVHDCISKNVRGEDAAYVVLEANKNRMKRGEFSFALLRTALRQYGYPDPNYDARIGILKDAIGILQTRDLDFGRFGTSLIVNSPEAKTAVIEELSRQIDEQEALKAGIEQKDTPLVLPNEAYFPGDIITSRDLKGEERKRHDEARSALNGGDFNRAISLWESMGDKENAAAALMRSGGTDIAGQLAAVDQVVQRYPDTHQAAKAGYKKAKILLNAGNYKDCLHECDKYAAAHPESDLAASAYCEVGMSLYMSGSNADMAIEALEKGTILQAEVHKQVYVPPILLIAASYEMKGDRKAANDVLRKYIAALRSGELSPTPTDGGDSLAREAAIQALEERLAE